MESRCVLLKNMFTPEEYVVLSCLTVCLTSLFDRETDADWDKELAEDVKGECETKYGPVDRIKVEKESQVKLMLYPRSSMANNDQGEIYLKFGNVDAARKSVQGLNGRWFGGKQVSATFISDAIMQAHQ
jgi:RNA-binding protein 23/39